MQNTNFSELICPESHQPLTIRTDPQTGQPVALVSSLGHEYAIKEGLPIMLPGSEISGGNDTIARNREYYRRVGSEYDAGMDWLFRSFHAVEDDVKESLIDRLRIEPGANVVEIGSGTGRHVADLARRVGPSGRLHVTDISQEMMHLCRARLDDTGILSDINTDLTLLVCDGTKLPFADSMFDAAYHFGGLNLFGDVRRGLSEMARVVKPGGRVVVGDEGVAPWLRSTEFADILVNSNPLYRHTAPLDQLPVEAEDVNLNWILEGSFYVFDFTVRAAPPKLDLDLPIPGSRGGTHRTRFQGRLEGIDPLTRDKAAAAARAEGKSLSAWLEDAIKKQLSD